MQHKLQPQAVDLEEAVLGAIMLDRDVLANVSCILRADNFYKPSNKNIYIAIQTLFAKSEPVDILTVVQELKRVGELDNVGGASYVAKLTNGVSSSCNAEYHSRIILEQSIRRELIQMTSELLNNSYTSNIDVFESIGEFEKKLTAINNNISLGKVLKINNLWESVVERNQRLLSNSGMNGVPCGYYSLDKITGGWQAPDLIILAARPGIGKTSLAINFARNAAVEFKKAGLIFSLEMSAQQIATRAFSLESNVSNSDFLRRGIREDYISEVQKSCSKLINSEIYIDDTPAITLQGIKSVARKLKREKNIDWIMVDYLQLMGGEKGVKQNREQEISSFSRGLKELAKELHVPIIALSQLNRAVESRGGDKRPNLSDLRESGAIEQDADIVMFIHRPEKYGIMEYEDGESTAGIAEIIIAKHRNGAIGTEKLGFIDYLTKFTEINN